MSVLLVHDLQAQPYIDFAAERAWQDHLYSMASDGAYAARLAVGTKYLEEWEPGRELKIDALDKACVPDGSIVLVTPPTVPDQPARYVVLLKESQSSAITECRVGASWVAVNQLERIDRPAAEVIAAQRAGRNKIGVEPE